ncbi:hypothetical protein PIB30_026058 [Stylosanthes scabra]|uniref:GIR1-like zinc ribbon domain-containing protein n=1 Tax=Stylosanthes scabra TaxID=79078 RepID=A0ABU6Q9X5_9FABA|nr:hypothetical protein [Stylosanthes scabra]
MEKSEAATPKLIDMLNIDANNYNIDAISPLPYSSILTLDALRKYFLVSYDLNQPAVAVNRLDQGGNQTFMVVESSGAANKAMKNEMGKKVMISSSSENNNNGDLKDDGEEVPSLVVMGCINCFLYVMVPKKKPECPRCGKNTNLLDVANIFPKHKPNKRTRISQI